MLQVEMEFLNYYNCKLKERKFHHVREKTLHLRSKNYYSAAVGVPKSLLIKFEFMETLCANFLVTNSKTLPDESL